MSVPMNYLDGNTAAGELSRIFAMDITSAEGKCANCGAMGRFAEAHLYVQCPGLVARCALCGYVLLRCVTTEQHVFLDLRGMKYLALATTQLQEAGS